MDKTKHKMKAFTIEGDFIPTLYVEGIISTNGQKPVVSLLESDSPGINPKILLLKFSPDVYDPTGSSILHVRDYEQKLASSYEFSGVTIQTSKGDIDLQVTHQPRRIALDKSDHTLEAWVYEGETKPTLYIEGSIPSDKKVIVSIEEADSPDFNPNYLALKFSPDVYDPAVDVMNRIRNYDRKLESLDQYSHVTLRPAKRKEEIRLKVVRKPRTS